MRKRLKGHFICRVTPSTEHVILHKPVLAIVQKPYVRIFGNLMPIGEHEIAQYQGFKIVWK